jgi:hypothetical protein
VKTFTRLLSGLAIVLCGFAFTGCNAGAEVAVHLEKLAAKACECKDAGCATQMLGEFTGYIKEQKGVKGTQENVERANKATTRLMSCLTKAKIPPGELLKATKELRAL